MYYFVYETTNLINGKTYRGCHKTMDVCDGYLGSGKLLFLAIKKYGKENFNRQILEFSESEEAMYELEKIYVDESYVNSDLTYNLRCGGLGGRLKLEIRQIIREKLKKPNSEETREKMRVAKLGKKHSESTLLKISKSSKGRKPSEEARQKMSDKAKNRVNNATGTIWITNGRKDRRVHNDSVIEDGWQLGRSYIKPDYNNCNDDLGN